MSAVQFRLSTYWLEATAENWVPEAGKQERTGEAMQSQKHLALSKYLPGSNNHFSHMCIALHKPHSQSLSNWLLTNTPGTEQHELSPFYS